ncbi:hypothetical protein L1987_09182 [Smallanthus sonchifolius]|uniref:Uncharacterized protein n=1 Tax=Smallanthus sonchifolius TaxID=185202 RepID=A0ACB9JPB2_9ASTR|nr:hypothetical protein L1987_09182 [Smallanthus sonchifolius]
MSSYSTGSKSYYSVTSDDEEPTEEPEIQTPTQEVEEPNYGARESWMIERFQMKADIEDDQIRVIKRLQALERHKSMSSTTPHQYTQGEDTELPEHPVNSTGYLADDDDESD